MKRILLVDGGEEGSFLGKMLAEDGHNFTCVESEAACVHHCDRCRYDVVFIDMESASIDSDRLVRVLHRRFPAMDVVSVSADDDPKAVEHVLHRGATAFLLKPVASETVADVLARLFEQAPISA